MPLIKLETFIKAPIATCFDLSRSVDLHLLSTEQTGEIVLAGKTSGLMELNDTVTWRARHLGVTQNLQSRISAYDYPRFFVSEMVEGAFRKLHHQHVFKEENSGTLMTDLFYFEAPFGLIGRLVCTLYLTGYMKRLLIRRNSIIRKIAEENPAAFLTHKKGPL